MVLAVVAGRGHLVNDGRQRRDVPDHRQRAVFRVQRQSDAVLEDEIVDRGLLCGIDPGVRDALCLGRADNLRIVGVEHDRLLGLEKVLLIFGGGGLGDAVGIVEDDAQVAQAAYTGLGAHSGLANLEARVAQRALFGLASLVVEVDLLIRAAGYAHAPAAAAVLVHQDDAVLGALVHRTGGAGGYAGRVHAVLANTRQVEHERVFDFLLDLEVHVVEHGVIVKRGSRATQVIVPVGGPFNLADVPAVDLGDRLGGRLGLLARLGAHQVLVLVGPGLVVILDGGQVGVVEEGSQLLEAAAGLGLDLAGCRALPAALPLFLVLPGARVAEAGAGFDVIEPDVLGAFAVGPCLLTGN